MFYITWAIRNLYTNRRRTIGVVCFISIISAMMFLIFAFLEGGQEQMKSTIRVFAGDISVASKKSDYSLDTIRTRIERSSYSDRIASIISQFDIYNARMFSDNAFIDNALIIGYSHNYFDWLKKSVEWVEGGSLTDSSHSVVMDASVATDLGVAVGDHITVEYRTIDGGINTASFEVGGIFIGNKYEHANTVLCLIGATQELAMAENNVYNRMQIYFNDPNDHKAIQQCVDGDLKEFSNFIRVDVWSVHYKDKMFCQVFQYAHLFIKFLLMLVITALLFILFTGIQNTFYLIFNKRANEISVLTTYGMNFGKIYSVIFFETILYFILGGATGWITAWLLGAGLRWIPMARLSEEMIVVLGGPNLRFSFTMDDAVKILIFVFFVMLFSSFHALRKYFKIEVRAMRSGI